MVNVYLNTQNKTTTGLEQVAFINDMIKLWEERAEFFPAVI